MSARFTATRLLAPGVAAGLALLVVLTGAAGVDLAAATYRVELFARSGLTLWDSQWYGGHWTFDYSVLFAPIGWLAGIPLMEIACVAVAAWAFDRLVAGHFTPRAARGASIVFAVGTVVQVTIGQEPYLLGETVALVSLLAAVRGRWIVSLPLALAAGLASPLAGVYLAMAAVAWMVGCWPARRSAIALLASVAFFPVVVLQVLFPGLGTMPFATMNFIGMVVALVPLAFVTRRRHRAIAVGVGIYLFAVIVAFGIPSAMGNNITRLGVSFGTALVVALALNEPWSLKALRARALLVVAFVPLVLAQWAPPASALLGHGNASMTRAYFAPLLGYLGTADRPLGRVEVVPTALHWESAYVAPEFPLARGWERQLDTVNNALFYSPGALTPQAYRVWLVANGVRFVAVPDVALDYAGVAEGALVRRGVPGLREVWHSPHWSLYAVATAGGIVVGPARLVSSSGGEFVLDVRAPGRILVRERYVTAWQVTSGRATVSAAPGGWTYVDAAASGAVTLRIAF